MLNIEFSNETNNKCTHVKELKGLIKYAAKYMNVDNVEFGVIFVDNKRIHEINKEYRGIDRETDVITFRLEDYEEVIYDNIKVLGDIAKEQSILYGHSYLRELAFLLVHGFLHLLGYDHMKKEDEEVMFKLQEDILDGYGIKRESS